MLKAAINRAAAVINHESKGRFAKPGPNQFSHYPARLTQSYEEPIVTNIPREVQYGAFRFNGRTERLVGLAI